MLGSRAGRTLCVLLLLVFVVLCGLHIAGVHHDGHSDSFGLAADILVVVALAAALLVLVRADLSRVSAPFAECFGGHCLRPLRPPATTHLFPGAPLRC